MEPRSSTVHAEVPAELAGGRLDAAVRALAGGLSRQQARSLCALGAFALDGVRATPDARLRAGSIVSWRPDTFAASLRLRLAIAFLDDDLLVAHKPPGLAVHAGPLVADSVAARLAAAFPGAGLAHRIDRGASGLLLCGLHARALAVLGAAMEQGRIERIYLAVTCGEIQGDARTVDLPLRTLDEPRGDRPKVVVDEVAGQPAVTHLRVLSRRAGCTLVQARLATGRTHQIRAHLRAIAHPLLGDPRYGDPAANGKAHATWGTDRPLLHGWRLAFPHPRTGAPTTVEAFGEPDLARPFPSLRGPSAPRGGD